jgi:serine/threonine-protein kinase
MSLDARIIDLLLRWEEAHDHGRPLTPEELCRDCPELLAEFRERVRDVQGVVPLLDTPLDGPPTGPAATHVGPEGATSQPEDASSGSRYRRLRLHAKGGLGEVYVGLDAELRREVALKRIQTPFADHPEARRRFLREAEVTSRLEHPGVVPVYGLVADADGTPCYAMRFIQGESLRDALQRFHEADKEKRDPGERSLAFRELLTRFAAVCKTLAYAHSRGVIHRDLKPANIMLGKYGETLVVDWGLARPVERTEEDRASGEETLQPVLEGGTGETQVGQALGTPAYMSPEQAAGRWDVVGPASDIYSLGATLYTLLTGQAPFGGKNHAEVLQKVQRGAFAPPRQVKPGTPAALQAICLKAMALQPEDRYATALELAGEVERWLADERVQAYQEPWREQLRRRARRHKPLVATAAALLLTALVLGSGGGVWLRQYYAELRRGTEAALGTAAGLRDAARWPAALEILDQAEARLGSMGPADLRQRVAQARAGVQLAERLETIRLQRATILIEQKFANSRADQEYAAAFRDAGLGEEGEEAEAVAARIHDSMIGEQLVAALDDWAVVTDDPRRRDWLLKMARQAGPDPWGDRFRDPNAWRDRAVLKALAGELLGDEAKLKKLKPQLLAALGEALKGANEDAVPLLAAAQAHHPNDFWLNLLLGNTLNDVKQWERAEGYHGRAVAVRPEAAVAHNNFGIVLAKKGQLDEAIREFRTALDLDPRYAAPHSNLGNTLKIKGQLDEAIREFRTAIELDPKGSGLHNNLGTGLRAKGLLDAAIREYRTAIELDPKHAPPHYNLGNAFDQKGHLDEAIREYRTAITLDPKYAEPHNGLGNALKDRGRLEEAMAEYRQAIALDPKFAPPHNNLGNVHLYQGRLEEARQEYQQAVDLGSKEGAERLRRCDRLLALTRRLPAVLQGEELPTHAAEWLDFATLCQQSFQSRYAASARFYTEAFAHDTKLADDMQKQHRYNAACTAALASCGQGADAAKLDETERACLRRQALDWLRDDLAFWTKQAASANPQARAFVQRTLTHWQADTDLAGLRDQAALAQLPEAERQACQQLWADVADLLKRAAGGK